MERRKELRTNNAFVYKYTIPLLKAESKYDHEFRVFNYIFKIIFFRYFSLKTVL